MAGFQACYWAAAWLLICQAAGADLRISDDLTLNLPPVGAYQLRVITPTVLELVLITTKGPDPAVPQQWNFVDRSGKPNLPRPRQFLVSAGTEKIEVKSVGFKRRVLYAPLKQRDLRIAN